MFSVCRFEFTNEELENKVIIEPLADQKTEVKVYLDIEDDSKKTVVCKLNEQSSNSELLRAGEQIAKEIDSDFEFIVKTPSELPFKYLIESMLIGLTPTNYYARDYQMPKIYKVKGDYSIEAAYIDAANSAFSYNIARVLNHLPYSDCNPDTIITMVQKLFGMPEVNLTIMRAQECSALNLNGMLTLARGSSKEPTLIKIEYRQNTQLPNVALVGKGIMFDTGGYSLKKGRDISAMKADMGGASAVLGTLHYLASTHADANVTGYLLFTDNMINENAMIPGDIITYANGLSVEIANTDAEGRLILADGILLAKRDLADQIIDIATLTGSAEAALGIEYAAMFSNNQDLANKMLELNNLSNDKVWQLPLVPEYKQGLKGNISDLRNISSIPFAGSISAALFLEAFAEDSDWIHIDMAAQSERAEYGTKYSGYGVRLLSNYILNM